MTIRLMSVRRLSLRDWFIANNPRDVFGVPWCGTRHASRIMTYNVFMVFDMILTIAQCSFTFRTVPKLDTGVVFIGNAANRTLVNRLMLFGEVFGPAFHAPTI